MSRYVDEHSGRFGVEPICQTLGVSASAYYQRKTGERSARALEDERLVARIRALHAANYYAYGYRRMWKALGRAGEHTPRCRVQRLMRADGMQGAKRRGKPWRTTKPDPAARRRADLVGRDFAVERPNRLWVADLSYLRCWEGLVFFAFVLDAFSRRVVGWQLAGHMRTTLVLDGLRMALGQRAPGADVCLVHHSDRGSQYTSVDYTQTLADHGVLASVGSVGDAYDNALAESFVDSFKTELIADRVWRSRSQLELATVEWIGWFNHERLHESLGDLPPVEFEAFHAARRLISGDGSVAALPPRPAERLSAARTGPAGAPAGRNGADPGRPSIQIAADASPGSPYGLAALDVGTGPTTLP
ncbi:MAG: IS3 family transposase [Actinobacteria bacterium]|nr:IS3 family transposase [Actinomycetota bacterium]